MTIKNTDKNVSAENDEVVADVTYSDNGILTIVRKNLYNDTEVENRNVDLSDHKLKLRILEDEAELRALEASDDETDIKDKQSYVFLVPFESDEEGVYREYIWIEDENNANGGEFEAIGSTKVNLTNYIQKSQTNGLIKNTGEIDTTSYASDSELSSAINSLGNFFGGRIATLEQLTIIKSNGNYYLDVSGTQKGATIEIPDITGKEDKSNKITSWSNTSSDTKYPSEKLVKDELNTKANSTHNHSSSNITDMAAVTVTITYTDNTTETLTLFKQVNNS